MHNYLTSEARHRFDIAWRVLPVPVREQLSGFVVSIRETDGRKGTRIRQTDGTFIKVEMDHGGCCVRDETGRCRILLNREFCTGSCSEHITILTILHEFAHAYEYLEDNILVKQLRSTESQEASAYLQAAAWALRDPSLHKGMVDVALDATKLAYEEIAKLKNTERIDAMLNKITEGLSQEPQ